MGTPGWSTPMFIQPVQMFFDLTIQNLQNTCNNVAVNKFPRILSNLILIFSLSVILLGLLTVFLILFMYKQPTPDLYSGHCIALFTVYKQNDNLQHEASLYNLTLLKNYQSL